MKLYGKRVVNNTKERFKGNQAVEVERMNFLTKAFILYDAYRNRKYIEKTHTKNERH